MAENRTLHILIHGRVQGVSFRAWTQHQAQLHGLKGWVRNRRDGTVEALFAGPGDRLDIMLTACHEGPSGSRVERVEVVEEGQPEDRLAERFEIRGTN